MARVWGKKCYEASPWASSHGQRGPGHACKSTPAHKYPYPSVLRGAGGPARRLSTSTASPTASAFPPVSSCGSNGGVGGRAAAAAEASHQGSAMPHRRVGLGGREGGK